MLGFLTEYINTLNNCSQSCQSVCWNGFDSKHAAILKQENKELFFSQVCELITNFEGLNDVDKFIEIWVSTNEDVIVSSGKFIYDGFKSRNQICINTI